MEIMTSKEVCDFLKISIDTLNGLIICHDFPYIQLKNGGNYRFRKQSILNWVEQRGLPIPINSDLNGINFLIHK